MGGAVHDAAGGAAVTDMINHPPHYTQCRIEPIDVIEDWKLGFCDGNAVKYIARHKHKGAPVEDLKKARWYLDRLIRRLEWCQKQAANRAFHVPDDGEDCK